MDNETLARIAALRDSQPALHPNAELVTCPTCTDTRWIDHDTAMAPCHHCNPVGYRRWREGHWRECRCAECDLAQSGNLKVGRDIDPVTGELRPGVVNG
jgi:hypothetical protein